MAFDPELATQAYMATLSSAARAKSDGYLEGGYWLPLWGAVVGVASNWLILQTVRAARLSGWTGRIFFDHPSGHTRVLPSMQWKAEHLGESDVR